MPARRFGTSTSASNITSLAYWLGYCHGLTPAAASTGTDPSNSMSAVAVQGNAAAVYSRRLCRRLSRGLFPEGPRRAKAVGVWSAVAGTGAVAGSILGGVLTDLLNRRWILFVNAPIGLGAFVAAWVLLTKYSLQATEQARRRLDVTGAILVTAGLMAVVYGLVDSTGHGWSATSTLAALAVGVLMLAGFVAYEAGVARAPLMPLRLLRSRPVGVANLVMFWLNLAVFAGFFFQSLYMQNVLAFSPLMAGLGFVPQSLAMIAGAQISSRAVGRIGARPLLVGGSLISFAGLAWLSRLTSGGSFWYSLFILGMLVTLGVGLAMTPLALTATSGVPRSDAGLASGLLNSTRQIGACVGLAVLSTLAADRSQALHTAPAEALTSGYALAFGVAAAFVVIAAAMSLAIPHLPQPGEPTGRRSHQGE